MVKKQWKTCCHATGRKPHSHSALMLLLSEHKEFLSKPHSNTASPNPHTVNPRKQSTQETTKKVISILRAPACKGRETLCYSNNKI